MFSVAPELPTHFINSLDHPEHELAARYISYKNPNLPFSNLAVYVSFSILDFFRRPNLDTGLDS